MKAKHVDQNSTNEAQPQDAPALRDLPLQKLTEAEADYAEEIKGGQHIKKAVLFVRKAGGNDGEY